jgi:hypothetical protein
MTVNEALETFGMEEVEPGTLPGEMASRSPTFLFACYVVWDTARPRSANCWPGPILGAQPKSIQSNFTNLQYQFWYRMLAI